MTDFDAPSFIKICGVTTLGDANAAIDAGADLILGTHPHVAEPIEIYHHRPICYSLGNCLFDRSGHYTANGLLVLIRLEKGKVTLERQVALIIMDARPMTKR